MALIILLSLTLLFWITSLILSYSVKDKRTKAIERDADSRILLAIELRKLNNRIDSYYHTKKTEQEAEK